VGVVTTLVCYAVGLRGFYPLLTFGLAGFVTLITLRELALPVRVRMRERSEGVVSALLGSATKARRRFGGYVVHLAIVLIIVAIAASSSYVTHATATLREGQSFQIGGYDVKYTGLTTGQEPHRTFVATMLQVTTPGGKVEQFAPRMNYYERMTDPVGSPAVREGPGEDLYVSLLAFSERGATASFNAWVFPLVSWIWWSIPLLVLGSLISLWPARRARASAERRAGATAEPQAAAGERGAA
jgi:cytochrome c-type biogenesis protein CcmF